MNAPFKITKKGRIYRYLQVHTSQGKNSVEDSNRQLQIYLSLIGSVAKDLEAFIALSFSPYVGEVIKTYLLVECRYELEANDFFGIGVDKGFQRSSFSQMFFSLKDIMTLRSFPEDSLGDKASELSVFLLHKDRKNDLIASLNCKDPFYLNNFLRPGEKFAHLTCGKAQGYFDALLICSNGNITQELEGFISRHKLEDHF